MQQVIDALFQQSINETILEGFPFKVKYKNRNPDPGECKVIAIDWEKRRMCVSNGAARLYPEFHEIELIKNA